MIQLAIDSTFYVTKGQASFHHTQVCHVCLGNGSGNITLHSAALATTKLIQVSVHTRQVSIVDIDRQNTSIEANGMLQLIHESIIAMLHNTGVCTTVLESTQQWTADSSIFNKIC